MQPSTPRRKKIDRFIPHREGIDLGAAFSATASVRQSPERPSRAAELGNPADSRIPEMNSFETRSVYSAVLKSEIFGTDSLPQSSSYPFGSELSPERRNSSHSLVSSNSHSSLSLPMSSRRRGTTNTVFSLPGNGSSASVFRYSPRKLLRSDSELSDISLGSAGGGGGGLGTSLRPESRDVLLQPKPKKRVFRQTPFKTLDAPGLSDDFYLNLLDWGPSDLISIGLSQSVYVWNPVNGGVSLVTALKHDHVTSLAWMHTGEHVAVGTSSGKVQIYDVVQGKRLRTMVGHTRRASSLTWNDHILSSGSLDCSIIHHDTRLKENIVKKLDGHRGEVCGLKWNVDTQQLASGGNDNKLKIWQGVNSATSQGPLYEFDEHTSAVKGLAWSPHQRGLLASGGGFCDRSIWFWNTSTGKSINSVNTGSQVCNLAWSPKARELISSHGNHYNDVVVWKYSTMQPLTRFRMHASRVLHLALSPDGNTLATGAGDETLRMWSMFDEAHEDIIMSALSKYGQLR